MDSYLWEHQCWSTKDIYQLWADIGCSLENLPRAMDDKRIIIYIYTHKVWEIIYIYNQNLRDQMILSGVYQIWMQLSFSSMGCHTKVNDKYVLFVQSWNNNYRIHTFLTSISTKWKANRFAQDLNSLSSFPTTVTIMLRALPYNIWYI